MRAWNVVDMLLRSSSNLATRSSQSFVGVCTGATGSSLELLASCNSASIRRNFSRSSAASPSTALPDATAMVCATSCQTSKAFFRRPFLAFARCLAHPWKTAFSNLCLCSTVASLHAMKAPRTSASMCLPSSVPSIPLAADMALCRTAKLALCCSSRAAPARSATGAALAVISAEGVCLSPNAASCQVLKTPRTRCSICAAMSEETRLREACSLCRMKAIFASSERTSPEASGALPSKPLASAAWHLAIATSKRCSATPFASSTLSNSSSISFNLSSVLARRFGSGAAARAACVFFNSWKVLLSSSLRDALRSSKSVISKRDDLWSCSSSS
mmetsp:Transcript_130514/g.226806  ORF Transcript_130514/g.226806 Transcript_130514/m.226806 type:complete len:331 (-) Transcript_130514:2824-3816(-)